MLSGKIKIIIVSFTVIVILLAIGVSLYIFNLINSFNYSNYQNNLNQYRLSLDKSNFSSFKTKVNLVNNYYENKINVVVLGGILNNNLDLKVIEPYMSKNPFAYHSANSIKSIKIQELDCQLKDNQIIIKARGIPNNPKAESDFMIGCEVKNLAKGKYQVKYGEQGEVLDSFEILDIPKR